MYVCIPNTANLPTNIVDFRGFDSSSPYRLQVVAAGTVVSKALVLGMCWKDYSNRGMSKQYPLTVLLEPPTGLSVVAVAIQGGRRV